MYTGSNIEITSNFYRLATRSEINKGLSSQEKPIISVPATDYINTPIEVVAGIRIAGIYVVSNIETIRLRVTEAIVFRKISIDSTFSEDMGIKPIEDEDNVSE